MTVQACCTGEDCIVPRGLPRLAQSIAMSCWLWGTTAVPAQQRAVEKPLGPVAEQIREQVERWRDVHAEVDAVSEPRNALAVFYEQGQFAPVWTRRDLVDQLLAALRGMAGDGLDPEDYASSELQRLRAVLDDPQATSPQQARFDVLATDACLSALGHLYSGKVAPATLDTHWNFDPRQFDQARGLDAVRAALLDGTVASLFARARPQDRRYGELRTALANLREVAAQGGWPLLEGGPTLKPGNRDPRVPMLRQRLRLAGYPVDEDENDLYDPALEESLRQFQREQHLAVDGYLGNATLAALNVPLAARIEQLRANLERARWLLHELRGDFVMVDIAGYQISYFKDGELLWRSRVQVGLPYRRTPMFKSEISYLTLNPTWTVPPGILRNDVLPKVREDPGYLAANRIRVLDRQGRELSPASVNWADPRGIVLRQDPGQGNSLGRLVVRFPNDYLVYLHDTPQQHLFDREQRTFSSGCIRVELARELAELLLDDPVRWNRSEIDRAIDTLRTQTVMLREPIPVLLAYWTVDLHDRSRVSFRPDVYRRDPPLIAALARPYALP